MGKQKVHRAKEVTFYDYQFFDQAALRPLLEKERGIVRVQSGAEEKIEFIAKEELTEEEEKKKEELLKAGFAEWGRRDFQAYIRANEKHGRSNIAALAKEIEGKDEPEVRRYAEVFWERGEELSEWAKLVAKIEEGEKRLERQHDINRAIQLKVKRYKNPLFEMKFNYGASKGKAFNEEADRYLICMTHKLGWGQWEELKYHIRSEPLFRFDWFLKSRTPLELKRRIETLVRTIEKELEGPLKKDKEKRRASVGGGGKRKASLDGPAAGPGKKMKKK